MWTKIKTNILPMTLLILFFFVAAYLGFNIGYNDNCHDAKEAKLYLMKSYTKLCYVNNAWIDEKEFCEEFSFYLKRNNLSIIVDEEKIV